MIAKDKNVIKWYEYDHSKLYEKVESEDVTEEENAEPEPEQDEPVSLTGDADMDDEVARIMAAFSGAKQNNVDDIFAMMAAEEAAAGADEAGDSESEGTSEEMDQDSLIASICAPKQNNVDDLVNMAKES
ncbi:MAG: hypothetical protein K6E63_07320 [Lachnospiraceae bacterium]|nr:hypothetical protein [Lachnospiraceae bacterium]